MTRNKLAAFLVTSPQDYLYLIGFTGEDSAVLVTKNAVHLLTDGRFADTAQRDCPWATPWIRRGSLYAELAAVCRRLRLRSLAVQPEHLSIAGHDDIRKQTGLRRITSAPPIVARMRRIKGPTEIRAVRRALRVAEEAFLAMRPTIRPGQTELELAARLEYEMKSRGASGPAFETICAIGPNAAFPHARPGRKKVTAGCAILLDWGARVEGYCSDLTRMVFVGSIPARIGKAYHAVLEAQGRALHHLAAGRRACDIDATARGYLAEAGYGGAFTHGLGHGLGLDVHEPPALSWRSDEKLQAGMVVTVEPGVYLPGVGGVRIEDDALVTPNGARVLSRLSKDIDDAVVRPAR